MSYGKQPGHQRVVPALYLESGDINPDAVRYYRSQHNMSQADLAALLGLHHRTISNLERGDRVSAITQDLVAQFVKATQDIMRKHNGIVPGPESFKYIRAMPKKERDQALARIMAERDRLVEELRQENAQLRWHIKELEQQLRENSYDEYISAIERLNDEVTRLRQRKPRALTS